MKVCPIPFSHPSEAQQLHGFGPKLCDRLTAKLIAHCEQNGLPIPELPHHGIHFFSLPPRFLRSEADALYSSP